MFTINLSSCKRFGAKKELLHRKEQPKPLSVSPYRARRHPVSDLRRNTIL